MNTPQTVGDAPQNASTAARTPDESEPGTSGPDRPNAVPTAPTAGVAAYARRRPIVAEFVYLARPAQWVKNLAVLAGPIFGRALLDATGLWLTAMVFAAFCLASSAVYAINDTIDRHVDAQHPRKRLRPVASGAIAPAPAIVFGVLMAVLAIAVSLLTLPNSATLAVGVYLVLMFAYTMALKQRMILDVILIAVGFVLRAIAGAEAVDVVISPWLIICTFMIFMFMGFGKRRCELASFETADDAKGHRRTLMHYTPELLNHLISVTAGIAIITFVQYTMDPNPLYHPEFPKEHLLYTLPLVAYGIFRYAMLVQSGRMHGPTEILMQDRPFLVTVALWTLIAFVVVYSGDGGAGGMEGLDLEQAIPAIGDG